MKLSFKKQLLAFGISALALVGAGAGITYALFQDDVTISENVIVTGNLRADVTLYDSTSGSDVKIYERLATALTPTTGFESGILIEPNDVIPATGFDFKLVIVNQGSLSGTATVTLQNIFNATSSCSGYLPSGATCTDLAFNDPLATLAAEPVALTADATLNTVTTGTQVVFDGTDLLASTVPAEDTMHLLSAGATGVTLASADTLEISIHIDITLKNDYHNVLTKVFAFVTALHIHLEQVA